MKRTNRILTFILVAAIVLTLAVPAAATWAKVKRTLEYEDIKITLDGEELIPRDVTGKYVEPFTIDGTTYLPVRAVSSALGLSEDWDGATSTVILERPEAGKQVYITRTGKKYHFDPKCNGGTYWPVSMETANGFGLEPCDKCVLKGN